MARILSKYCKGVALCKLGKYKEAIAFLNEALKIDGWSLNALNAKYKILSVTGGSENIVKYLKLKMEMLEIENNRIIEESIDSMQKEEDRVHEEFIREQRIADGTDESLLNDDNHVEEYYMDENNNDGCEDKEKTINQQIIKRCDEKLAKNPFDIEILLKKGRAIFAMGRRESFGSLKAFDTFDKILEIDPDYPIGNFIDDIEHLK